MKYIVRISLLSLFVCLFIVPALAQKRAGKAAASGPQTICQGDAVPKGFVVVEARRSSKCVELTVKKPATSETVCNGSPIPSGYMVIKQDGSLLCSGTGANPLTNAMIITSDDDEAERAIQEAISANKRRVAAKTTTSSYDDAEEETPRSAPRRAVEPARQKPTINTPTEPSRKDVETAVRRSTVILGMQMQDVSRAWGSGHTNDNLYEEGQRITIWRYRRGEVRFRNGVVYEVLLLKG